MSAENNNIKIKVGPLTLNGILAIPNEAKALVLFAHGSGSSRHSPRNQHVAAQLNEAGLATLLIDLLTEEEETVDVQTAHLRFDIDLLKERLLAVTHWLGTSALTKHLKVGYFGASTGAAAALKAAAEERGIYAVVSRGGRPDLAGDALARVQAPTLLIVGGDDPVVVELNHEAARLLSCEKKIEIVPGASHLFEESGALDEVGRLSCSWFKQKIPFFLLFLSPLFLLSSCLRLPMKEDEGKAVCELRLDKTADTALNSPYFEGGEWPKENWWEMFHDPQLTRLIEVALEDSPTIMKAEARVRAARKRAAEKRSALFPQIDFNTDVNWEHIPSDGLIRFGPVADIIPAVVYQIDLGLNFSYDFDLWGKNRNLFQAALGLARAQEAEAAQVRIILSTSVAQAYFTLQTDMQQKKLLEKTLEFRRSYLDVTQQRYEQKIDTSIQPLQQAQEILALERNLMQYEEAIALSHNLIKDLLGLSPDDPLCLNDPVSYFDRPFPIPTNLSADLLARRADIMAQIWRIESMAHEVGAAKADYYPSLNLTALAGIETLYITKLFVRDSWNSSLMPAIHLPIFNAGRIRAHLRVKRAEFDEAVYTYNEMILQAAKEVADQIVTLRSTDEQLCNQRSQVETQEKIYKLVRLRFTEGIVNYFNVLDQDIQLVQQRQSLIGLKSRYLQTILSLIKALGGGYGECE